MLPSSNNAEIIGHAAELVHINGAPANSGDRKCDDDLSDTSFMRALPWRGVTRRVRAAPWQIVDYLLEIRLVSAIRARRYRRAVQAHRGTLPVLDESWSGIATRLREHGIAQSDLRTLGLPGSSEMFDAAVGLVERWRARLREQARAGVDFLMVPANDLATQPEIFRFGLQPRSAQARRNAYRPAGRV